MRYGFKVHSLELARGINGRKRLHVRSCSHDAEAAAHQKAVDEATAAGDPPPAPPVHGDYLELLTHSLGVLKDRETALTDTPKMIAVADGANEFVPSADPGTVRMRVTDVAVSGRRVSVTLEYGYLGYAHKGLAERRADDAELLDKSPVEFYRTEFLVPDRGERGLIATESISRASSLYALTAWINHIAREEAGDQRFVRLMVPQLTDTAKLNDLLTGDTVSEIKLVRQAGVDVDGVASDNVITLTEKVRSAGTMDQTKQLIIGWIERIRSKDKMSEEERLDAIRTLAGIVGPEFEDVGFNDGVVKLDPGTGKKVEVRPSRIGELFTYEISDQRPSPTVWEERTKTQLLAMANAEDVSVVWS